MLGKKVLLVISAAVASTLIFTGCGAKKEVQNNTDEVKKISTYPQKTVKLISYSKEGSGPDELNRKVAEMLQKKMGWTFEITNEAGNTGADAVKKVWEAPHDGYTVLGQSENIFSFGVYGLTEPVAKKWDFYQILRQDSILVVKADSPYKTFEDLIKVAKENPGKIKIGGGVTGKSSHIKVKIIEKVTGAQFTYVPFGSGSDLTALMKGEVAAMSISTSAGGEAIRKGEIIPLIVLDLDSHTYEGTVGKVESITKLYPEAKKYLPLDLVIGFAMPSDVPKDVKDAFGKAFEEVVNSPEMAEYMQQRDATKLAIWGENAKEYVSSMESDFSWIIKEIGMAKVDPETLGISKGY